MPYANEKTTVIPRHAFARELRKQYDAGCISQYYYRAHSIDGKIVTLPIECICNLDPPVISTEVMPMWMRFLFNYLYAQIPESETRNTIDAFCRLLIDANEPFGDSILLNFLTRIVQRTYSATITTVLDADVPWRITLIRCQDALVEVIGRAQFLEGVSPERLRHLYVGIEDAVFARELCRIKVSDLYDPNWLEATAVHRVRTAIIAHAQSSYVNLAKFIDDPTFVLADNFLDATLATSEYWPYYEHMLEVRDRLGFMHPDRICRQFGRVMGELFSAIAVDTKK